MSVSDVLMAIIITLIPATIGCALAGFAWTKWREFQRGRR